MRHGKKFNHLGRKTAHRKSLLANLTCELIKHKRIITTLAKAKALRKYVEPLITKGKDNTTHNRRIVFSYLQNKEAVTELFDEIGGKVADRPGGYTRIFKLGFRKSDAAEMGMIELVDYNETMPSSTGSVKSTKKKTRRRGGKKAVAGVAAAVKDKVEEAVEAVSDGAETVIDKAGDAVEEVKEAAAAVVEEVKETVADVVEEVKETTADVVEEVKEKVADVVEEVKEEVSEVIEDAKEIIKGDDGDKEEKKD